MKKIYMKIVLAVALSFILFGCNVNINNSEKDKYIHGSGRIITENRNLSECSGIIISSVGTVYLTQSDEQSILIEADDNIIDRVITRNLGGSLSISLAEGSYSNITLRLYVSLKTITNLSISGAGLVECDEPITSDNITCYVNGAGKIKLAGKGNNINCLIDGAGNIDAKDFMADTCDVVVNGTGNCTVFVMDNLDASVNGVGSIIYYGNPTKITTSITGLGQIIRGS